MNAKKPLDAILFDLDGTLLPMDNDVFTLGYLKILATDMAQFGFEPKEFIAAMWKGVGDMVRNDGTETNEKRFWDRFSQELGDRVLEHMATLDVFYTGKFHEAKKYTSPNPLAAEIIRISKDKAEKVVLATNPFFPAVAIESRLEWIGLKPSDFDLVTVYSNSKRCKPNPAYYVEICEKLGLDAPKCLMVGNNVQEDIVPSRAVGMSAFLLTDCLINSEPSLPDCPRGGIETLLDHLEGIGTEFSAI